MKNQLLFLNHHHIEIIYKQYILFLFHSNHKYKLNHLTQEDIIKELKEKNNKLRIDLNNISNQLSKEEENYTIKLNDLEDKRRK